MNQNLTHREYSFLLHAGHLEKIPHVIGERTVQIDAGLTKDQAKSLYEAFSVHNFSGPEPHGEGYVLKGDDGYSLRILIWELNDPQKVSSIKVDLVTRTIDDKTLNIIFNIALTTNMILMNPVAKRVRFVGRDPSSLELEKWQDAARIDNIDELHFWFTEEISSREVVIGSD